MKICTWNVRRATKKREDVWKYFLEMDVDIALLQEVNSIPESVTSNYAILEKKAFGKNGKEQHFSTAVLVRGVVERELNLSSSWDWVNEEIKRFDGNLQGMKFAVWGLSFKPETDDVRESPSIEVIKNLIKSGAEVSVFDPKASKNFKKIIAKNEGIKYMESKESCLENSDALIIMTEWTDFKIDNYLKIKSLLKRPIIFDSRNFLDKRKTTSSGFEYFGIGRKGDV